MQTKNNLLAILFFLPLSLFSQHDFRVAVQNNSSITEIDGRSVLFGVKEKTEEILIEKGWVLSDTFNPLLDIDKNGNLTNVTVIIDKIESPHEILNIVGTKWLKKEYLVTCTIKAETFPIIYSTATGKRTNFLFAAFLEVEEGQIPLNRKSFSKSLEEALKKSVLRL
jgi:hypothetical protein